MAHNEKVTVIIVNYNGLKYLKDCLRSLHAQTYPNLDVIVCDNASSDGSVEFLQKNYPKIALIRNRTNLGFAKANNIAIESALSHGTDYVFLLNNDTEMEPDSLTKLVETAESNRAVGIVGPAVFDLKNRTAIQETGMLVDRFGFPMQEKRLRPTVAAPFFVSGCAMLVKKAVFTAVGMFDDEFFMFVEDLDLCWRAQLAGNKILVNRGTRIYHASGGSMIGGVVKSAHYKTNVKRIYLRERNTVRTLVKNYGTLRMLRIVPLYVSLLLVESALWFLLGKPQTAKNVIKALLWNIKAFPDTIRRRAMVQSIRKTSDREISMKMMPGYLKLNQFRAVGIPEFVGSR